MGKNEGARESADPRATPSATLPRTAKTFFRSALSLIPLHACLGSGALLLAAIVATRSVHGASAWWATIGGWTLTFLFVVAGLVGGALSGFLTALVQGLSVFEQECRAWIERLPVTSGDPMPSGLAPDELRRRIDQVVDRLVASTVGRLRLPAAATRLVRSQLRRAILDEFIESCERRGLTKVGAGDLRTWLLMKGLSSSLSAASAKVAAWRIVVVGALACLSGGALLFAWLH